MKKLVKVNNTKNSTQLKEAIDYLRLSFSDEFIGTLSEDDAIKLGAANLSGLQDGTESQGGHKSKVLNNVDSKLKPLFDEHSINGLLFINRADMINIVRFANVHNYLKGEKLSDCKHVKEVAAQVLLGNVTSASKTETNKAVSNWIKRAPAYINSHIVKDSDDDGIFNNKSFTYTIEDADNGFLLREKK